MPVTIRCFLLVPVKILMAIISSWRTLIKHISFYSRYFRYNKEYFHDFVGAAMHGTIMTHLWKHSAIQVRWLKHVDLYAISVCLHRGWLEAAFRLSDLLNNVFRTVIIFLKVRLELEMKLVARKLLKQMIFTCTNL